jgi:GTP cyclohydrolase IA
MALCRVPGCDHDPDSNCVNPGLWGEQGTLPEGYREMASEYPEVSGAGVPFEPVVISVDPGVHVAGTALTDISAGKEGTVVLREQANIPLGSPDVIFGGTTAREALAMVTAEELAAELLKRVDQSWSPDNEHSANTPKRFVRSLKEMCNHTMDWTFTTFETDSDEMVTTGPIPFYTLCAHHVVPFYGKAWIGYVPDKLLCGLSKLARAVKYCAKGMWVQEELTSSIHHFIDDHLHSKGLAVVLSAEHMCMSMRGVEVAGAITTTAKMSGVFADHSRTAKAEFMEWTREKR